MDRLSLSLDLSGEPVLTCHSRRRPTFAHPRYRLADLLRSAGQQPQKKTTLLCITSLTGTRKLETAAGNRQSIQGKSRNGRPTTPAGHCRPLRTSIQSTITQLAVATSSNSRHMPKPAINDFSDIALRRAARLRLVRGKCVGRSQVGLQDKNIDRRRLHQRQSVSKEMEPSPMDLAQRTVLTGWEQEEYFSLLHDESMH